MTVKIIDVEDDCVLIAEVTVRGLFPWSKRKVLTKRYLRAHNGVDWIDMDLHESVDADLWSSINASLDLYKHKAKK